MSGLHGGSWGNPRSRLSRGSAAAAQRRPPNLGRWPCASSRRAQYGELPLDLLEVRKPPRIGVFLERRAAIEDPGHGAAALDLAQHLFHRLDRGENREVREDHTPDIYHFVFDRYGSENTLKRHFGSEAPPIGDFLEARGFYVAHRSFSNYLSTGHSLASTFHMDYLSELAADPRVSGNNWHPIFRMLDDNRVGHFLRGRGYEQHQFGSWWVGTYHNSNAANRPLGFSEFNMTYLRRTILMPVFHLLPDTALTRRLDWDNGQCQRVARQVEEIRALERGARPLYVFAHILVPHDPYVFTPDGRCLTRPQSETRGPDQGYLDQIGYANAIIEDLVTALLAEGRPPPIILIQADEGPVPALAPGVRWQDATDDGAPDQVRHPQRLLLPGRRLPPAAPGHLAGEQLPCLVREELRPRPTGGPRPHGRFPRRLEHLRVPRRDRPSAGRGRAVRGCQ